MTGFAPEETQYFISVTFIEMSNKCSALCQEVQCVGSCSPQQISFEQHLLRSLSTLPQASLHNLVVLSSEGSSQMLWLLKITSESDHHLLGHLKETLRKK